MMAKRISEPVRVEGIGIHSGEPVCCELKPASPGEGLYFVHAPSGQRVDVAPSTLGENHLRSTQLSAKGVSIQTPEHLLAACMGLGLTDLCITLDAHEVPILDGSAKPWVELIQSVGIVDSDVSRDALKIESPISLLEGEQRIMILPSSEFRVSYLLEYPGTVVGTQLVSVTLTPDSFSEEIAPARTFGFDYELEALASQGLAKGASLDNALLVTESGYSSALRLPDEGARHKILDIVGDFGVLGRPIQGHIIGIRSGHSLNAEAVKQLASLAP